MFQENWETRQRAAAALAPPPGLDGPGRGDMDGAQMPKPGWYAWRDDATGIYHTYYEDDDKNNALKKSYSTWASENLN